MEAKNYYEQIEQYSDEELKQFMVCMKELLKNRHESRGTYEKEFIDMMVKCGLSAFYAEMSLRDFKEVSAIYMQNAEPLFIEDVEQVLIIVLRKNEYDVNMEVIRMLNDFAERSFGNNIPSII